jgi:hypothetical protein
MCRGTHLLVRRKLYHRGPRRPDPEQMWPHAQSGCRQTSRGARLLLRVLERLDRSCREDLVDQ